MWDLVTGAQRYQFSSPSDQPTCVAYAPWCPNPSAAADAAAAAAAASDGLAGGDVDVDDFNSPDGVGNVDGGEVDEELLSPADGLAGRGGGAGGGVGCEGEEEWHLVAGYVSGALRVFDVPSAMTLFETQQHRGAVQQVGSVGRLVGCLVCRLDVWLVRYFRLLFHAVVSFCFWSPYYFCLIVWQLVGWLIRRSFGWLAGRLFGRLVGRSVG